jgi:hypothetical protein
VITRPRRGAPAALRGPAVRGAALLAAGSAWRTLPALPAPASSAPDGGTTLAAAPGSGFQALSAHGGHLSVWALSAGGSSWSRSQVINVSIPYGSSG